MLQASLSHPGGMTSYASHYPISYRDKIVYWYRLNPSNSGSTGGTTGNNPKMGQPELNPGGVSQDRVFISVLVAKPSHIHVRIGHAVPTILLAKEPGINHYSVPFNGQSGPVRFAIVRQGREIETAMGPAITDKCMGGMVNWNAFVGSS
jgi:aminopeptidase I